MATQTRRPFRWPASASVLLAANAFQLVGVLALGWSLYALVLLYWCENLIVGLFNVLRMLCAQPPEAGAWIAKLFVTPFFVVHYGGFTAVHGFAVVAVFGGGWASVPGVIGETGFPLAILLLGLSHGFSFFRNYLAGGECRRADLMQLTMQPYQRVFVLHLVIFAGAFALKLLTPSPLVVVPLILLKTGFDLLAHLEERKKFAEEPASSQPVATAYVSPRIRGRVVEEGTGRPIAGVAVLAFWTYASSPVIIRMIEATSAPDGTFAIERWTHSVRDPVGPESPQLVYFAPGCGLSIVQRPGPGTDELVYALQAVRSRSDAKRRAGELEQAAMQVGQLGGLLEVAPPPLRIADAIVAEWRRLPAEARDGRRSPAELYAQILGQVRDSLASKLFR